MSDPSRIPPPSVQAAAKIVDSWLQSVQRPPAPRRDMQRNWAERLERCRQYDQSKMPEWRDQQNAKPASPEEILRMTPAQKLDYARQWDQKTMPEWRDPRGR
jgi:hypothetical protein